MLLPKLSMWLGISTLYWGFSGVMGILLRRAWPSKIKPSEGDLATFHGLLFFLPASILILGLPEWHYVSRLFLIGTGLIIAALSASQPDWIPEIVWHRPFGHRYFAGTMAITSLWGISLTLTTHALVPSLVAVAATLTGAASWYTASQST